MRSNTESSKIVRGVDLVKTYVRLCFMADMDRAYGSLVLRHGLFHGLKSVVTRWVEATPLRYRLSEELWLMMLDGSYGSSLRLFRFAVCLFSGLKSVVIRWIKATQLWYLLSEELCLMMLHGSYEVSREYIGIQ